MSDKNRILGLDGLRGIAIISVVIYHFTTRFFEICENKYLKPNSLPDLSIGTTGVYLFFMISGFVIYSSVDNANGIKKFLISRFSRLYPAYWFGIILTTLFLMIFPYLCRPLVDLKFIPLNFTMFHTWIGTPNVDGSYWTLGVELMFYTVIAILIMIKQVKNAENILFGYISVLFIIQFSLSQLGIDLSQHFNGSLVILINTILFLGFGSLFIIGILLYKKFNKINDKYFYLKILVLYTQFLVLNYNLGVSKLSTVSVFLVLFLIFVHGNFKFLENRFLLFIAKLSYSWYLIHAMIGYSILGICMDYQVNVYLGLLITIALTLGTSYLMNIYIEVPLSKFTKNQLLRIFKD